jgi:aryl-alcohol dehydrogenase
MKITAAVARETSAPFSIETLDIEAPRAGEVLVRIVATGLCHTDIVVRDQILPTPMPVVLGHEGAGVVEAVGEGVTSVAPGDEVVLGFAFCGHCASCSDHQPGYCAEFMGRNFGGCRPDGSKALTDAAGAPVGSHYFGQSSFATYALAAESNVIKVSGAAQPLANLGPLGCGMMTGAGAVFNTLAAPAGSSIIVTGGGPVGLSGVMAAAARDFAAIVLVEPVAARRELGLELGATNVIDPAAGDVAEQLRAILPGGVDRALDSTGIPGVIQSLVNCLAPRGQLAWVGVPASLDATITLPIIPMMAQGLSVKGVTEGDADPAKLIPEMIALNAAGKFPFEKMIRTYPLAQINTAIDDQHKGLCVKAVLVA